MQQQNATGITTPTSALASAFAFSEEQLHRGHKRWVLTGFSSEAFHTLAQALCAEAEKQGILLGAVYDVSEQAGILFVQEEGFPQAHY